MNEEITVNVGKERNSEVKQYCSKATCCELERNMKALTIHMRSNCFSVI